MKPIKVFRIGSAAFFDLFADFNPKDIDELCIMDRFPFKSNVLHMNGLHGKDVFFFRNMSKESFILETRNSNLPMAIGKFLVPEFNKHIGFTIEDLKPLTDVMNKIDKKHEYEKIIFDSYIQNNDFYLTELQRIKAYKKYKENNHNG